MQPIPPRGPAELRPEGRLGGQEAAWQQCWCARAGGLPLAPLPSPRALPLPWPSGGPPGAGFPPTLGFWRFQSLCVWWCFPPLFSLIFKAFTTSGPFILSVTTPTPFPNSLANTAAARHTALRVTFPPLCPLPEDWEVILLHRPTCLMGCGSAPSPQRPS